MMHIENTTKQTKRQLAYIYHTFHHAGPDTLTHLYNNSSPTC